MPALANEFIVLLKETAIAGYIALDDLTRAGNIVRGRTFDAYTPFIVVALIYLYNYHVDLVAEQAGGGCEKVIEVVDLHKYFGKLQVLKELIQI